MTKILLFALGFILPLAITVSVVSNVTESIIVVVAVCWTNLAGFVEGRSAKEGNW